MRTKSRFFSDLLHNTCCRVFTGRNEVVAKVMFLHVSVILYTGGGSPENPPGTRQTTPPPGPRRTPQGPGRPPRQGDPPPGPRRTPLGPRRTPPGPRRDPPGPRRTPPGPRRDPPGTRQIPPRQGRRLQHTVNERPVRILLECILVINVFDAFFSE